MSPIKAIAGVVAPALMASCTTIGPTVVVGAGAGKSAYDFERDRKECMASTDRALQPVADRANLEATTAPEVAASNAGIQVAYDRAYGSCMAMRGNLVPAPTAPLPSEPVPPTPELAPTGPLRVLDATNMPPSNDPDSKAAERSIAPKVRALLSACPGETITITAHDAALAPGVTARLLSLAQPNGGDCLGNIGESDFLVAKGSSGSWRILLAAEPGSIGIRLAGHGGYRELELRSFGSCIYGYRWNGRAFHPTDANGCTLPAPPAPGGYADASRER